MEKRHLAPVPTYALPDLHELHLTDRELLALRDALACAVFHAPCQAAVDLYARVVALVVRTK